MAPGDSNTVAAGDSNGHVYVTTAALNATAATPWPASQPRAGFVSSVAFDPADRNTIYATYSTFKAAASDSHVYKSSDGGSTWTGLDGSGASAIPDVPVHALVVNPSDSRMLFVGTDLGLYSSVDGGATWNRDPTPFGEAPTGSLKVNTVAGIHYLYAFTNGRGVWRAAINTTTTQFPNLSITKTHTPTFYQGLQNGQYVITVSNGGPAATSGTVTVTEMLPSGLTATSMTGNGWSCTQPSGPCTQSTSLAAGRSYQPINLLVNVAPDAPASVQNTATATGGGDANIHTGTDPTTILPSPNLSITKTHTPTFYQGLTGGTYSMIVYNGGPGPTTSAVTVTDNLPAGLTATAIQGQGWTCTQPSGPCNRSDPLNSGLSYPAINLTVNVDAAAPASVTNTATLMGGGDANTHTATDPTNILPSPNLSITKTHTPTFYQGLTGGTYSMIVYNGGPGPTTSAVTVTDNLPAGLTATAIQGQGWTCTQPSGPCNRSDVLNSGLSYPAINLTVNVAPAAPASVTNTATLMGGGDANTHTATDPTNILPSPNLSITKTHSPAFYQGLTGGIYSMTVYNGGPGPTTSAVTVTDNLPAGLTATGIQGQGWTCTQPSGPCSRSDALNSGLSYPAINLTVNVPANAPSQVTNTATLTGGGDANTHTATDMTSITPTQPSLSITKTHTGSFTQGQTGATYTITVANNGQGTTSSTVTVSDSVPAGLTATAMGGNGWTCAQPAGPCTRSDALAGGSSYPPITLSVNVSPGAPSSVTNTATVSGGGDPSNHSASDLTSIGAAAPSLTISKSHIGNFAQGQIGAVYTIVVTNNGQGPTSGLVTVADNVPGELIATAIAGAGWACTQPAGPCTRSDALAAVAVTRPST